MQYKQVASVGEKHKVLVKQTECSNLVSARANFFADILSREKVGVKESCGSDTYPASFC